MTCFTAVLSEKQRAQLESEKSRIMQDKSIAEEERAKLVEEKEKKLVQLKKQQEAKEKLAAKIGVGLLC